MIAALFALRKGRRRRKAEIPERADCIDLLSPVRNDLLYIGDENSTTPEILDAHNITLVISLSHPIHLKNMSDPLQKFYFWDPQPPLDILTVK